MIMFYLVEFCAWSCPFSDNYDEADVSETSGVLTHEAHSSAKCGTGMHMVRPCRLHGYAGGKKFCHIYRLNQTFFSLWSDISCLFSSSKLRNDSKPLTMSYIYTRYQDQRHVLKYASTHRLLYQQGYLGQR